MCPESLLCFRSPEPRLITPCRLGLVQKCHPDNKLRQHILFQVSVRVGIEKIRNSEAISIYELKKTFIY